MLLIYFLLGLGITTAHSDYGVWFRAQHFDKTVRNIDKEAIINHRREKRFVSGFFVPQNLTNKPAWGNLNITRNNMTFTRQSNNSRHFGPNLLNNGTPTNTGYPIPNTGHPTPNTGYPAPTNGYPATNINPGQNYNTSVTRPVYPNYNNINVIAAYKNNFSNSNPSGYNIQPVNPVAPGNRPYYPVPNPGYPAFNMSNPAPNTGYAVPNTWYPTPTSGYPATTINPGQNYNTSVTRPVYPNYNNIKVIPANKNNFSNSNPSGYTIMPVNPVTHGNTPYYPVPNTGYPASNTSNLAPNTGYPAPNTGYPAPNTRNPATNSVYPAPNTGYSAQNTGYPVPNTGYPAPNTGYPGSSGYFNNNGNGFNNTASLENCKCKLPRANSTITKEERTMDACMITCNSCPEGMKMTSFGICVKDLDYDD